MAGGEGVQPGQHGPPFQGVAGQHGAEGGRSDWVSGHTKVFIGCGWFLLRLFGVSLYWNNIYMEALISLVINSNVTIIISFNDQLLQLEFLFFYLKEFCEDI